MKPRLLRVSHFIWLVFPALAVSLYQAWGLPHVIWNYRYNGNKSDASFRYIACSYVGPTGGFWHNAENGKCRLIRFRRAHRSSTK